MSCSKLALLQLAVDRLRARPNFTISGASDSFRPTLSSVECIPRAFSILSSVVVVVVVDVLNAGVAYAVDEWDRSA